MCFFVFLNLHTFLRLLFLLKPYKNHQSHLKYSTHFDGGCLKLTLRLISQYNHKVIFVFLQINKLKNSPIKFVV